MNIVFVCTGNTCRSPMAEALFRDKTKQFAQYCTVSSCGLAAFPGDPASDNAVSVMAESGIDISTHRSCRINQYIIDGADFIICLSESHFSALYPYAKDKLILLGKGISDPYGGNINTYRKCADEISTAIDTLLNSSAFFKTERSTPDIAPDVAEIEHKCLKEAWSEISLKGQIEKSYGLCYVGKFLGKPVCHISTDIIQDEIDIINIVVSPEYQNRGFGSALMNELIKYANKNDISLITLEVRASNVQAISFYNKFDFKSLGARKNFYRDPIEDALIMTKYFKENRE